MADEAWEAWVTHVAARDVWDWRMLYGRTLVCAHSVAYKTEAEAREAAEQFALRHNFALRWRPDQT